MKKPCKPYDPIELQRTHPLANLLEGWFFRCEEISAGRYQVEGKDVWGRTVARTGIDPDDLLKTCVADAKALRKDEEHLLCFVTDDDGQLFIHADAAGLDLLIKSLNNIRRKIDEDDCDHDHLMTESWGGDGLTEPAACGKEGRIIHHVKIYGWTEEWARKHQLKG